VSTIAAAVATRKFPLFSNVLFDTVNTYCGGPDPPPTPIPKERSQPS
jgi:hypothetical protein